MSRVHAQLEAVRDGYRVRDLRSRHGSYVNGVPVGDEGGMANFGSVLRLGDAILLVVPNVDLYSAPPRTFSRHMLGTSEDVVAGPVYAAVLDEAARVGAHNHAALVVGESGTGKEAVASAVHAASGRRGPFVALNISAVAPSLFEAELFGHDRGAYTGAVSARPGVFRQATGGTLFLDEIADLRVDLQVKLLRVIDQQRVRPVGATADVPIDVRLVTATSQDLSALCSRGAFRMDLYYRLSGIVLKIPPLRERRDEILLLAEALLAREGADRLFLSIEAAERLALATWEGNVRQLRFALTHAGYRARTCGSSTIQVDHLPELVPVAASADVRLNAERIRLAMSECRGNAALAARCLGVSRVTLYRACKRLGIKVALLRNHDAL